MPREDNMVWPLATSREHFSELHPVTRSLNPQMLKIIALCTPRDEPGFCKAVNPEGTRCFRRRLFRVGRYYFQIASRTQCKQGITCSGC
jgi:hypothetical protein